MPPGDWSAQVKQAREFLDLRAALPVIPSWSRLEPMTLTRGDLQPGASVPVADPLWMLGRQWQFDELRGEDAGSPIQVSVFGETAPLSRFHAGLPGDAPADAAIDLALPGTAGSIPLEARVEAERPAILPLRLRIQSGLHLMRLLRAAGFDAVATAAVAAYPVSIAPVMAPGGVPLADPVGETRARLAQGRVPDGTLVQAALDAAGGLPQSLAASGAAAADVLAVLTAWRQWADAFLIAPAAGAWNPRRLEHAFLTQAQLSDGSVTFKVEEYTGGTLDWFHGDLSDGPDIGRGAAPAATPIVDVTLPTPVRFAGMASDRLFGFEDAKVYFGGIEAGRTDLARLAVVEFSLAYSVDWFIVPLDLPYGNVTVLNQLRLIDTFGKEVEIRPSREASRPGWTMFQSTPLTDASRLADMFVLAPTVARVLEGPPIEQVALFRDEMANLVWGVERIVPGRSSGEPVARARQAATVSLVQPTPRDLDEAQVVYRLMTPVPENWLPFVAVRERALDVTAPPVLERRPMLRFLPDGRAELIDPQGTILLSAPGADPSTDRLRIAEEEVPREGVVVQRAFQMARTEDGGTALWIGRRVRTGRGEGASGLRFDTSLPPGAV